MPERVSAGSHTLTAVWPVTMHTDPARCSATPSGDDILSRSSCSEQVLHGGDQLLEIRRHAPPTLAASSLVLHRFACPCYSVEAEIETEHTAGNPVGGSAG
jgi:hypothetical protein